MRTKLSYTVCLVLLAIVAASAAAEPAPAAISVARAVEAAIRNNLSLKSSELEARAKKRASDFSFNAFYPTVTAAATAVRLTSPSAELLGDTYPQSGNLKAGDISVNSATYYYGVDQDNLALSFTVKEVFSASALLSMNQAALDYQTSALNREKAQKQIAAAARETFYQLLVQKEAIALTRSRLESAKERMRQAKVSMELGKGTELDYLNTQTTVESLIPELRGMEIARQAALADFQEMLGLDDRDDMELLGSLDDEKVLTAENAIPDGERFDVVSSQLSVQNLESALRLQNAGLLPTLILQYTADPALNDPSSLDRILDGDNWSQSSGGFSMTLSWNLSSFIPGSGFNLKQKELRERLALARESDFRSRARALKDEETQLAAIRASLDKLGNLQRASDAAKRASELTDAAYRAGSMRYLDLKSAEISAQSSQMQLLNERLNLIKLLCELDAKYCD